MLKREDVDDCCEWHMYDVIVWRRSAGIGPRWRLH